jgi:hypothetical protein
MRYNLQQFQPSAFFKRQSFPLSILTYEYTMPENISNNALILALLSLNGEIAIQNDYLESGEIPEEEVENEQEVLGDLEQAFMEFVDLYKARSRNDQTLPSLEELLAGEEEE